MRTRNSNKRSSLRAVSPESDESPEKIKRVSPRQKGRRLNTSKTENVSYSDKGYGGSSCDDDTECQRRVVTKAADFGVTSAKKRKNEDELDESSDSSSDDFLVPTQSLDLNSDFFKIEKKQPVSDFSAIENSIFSGINRLSESEDSDDLQDSKPTDIEIVANKQILPEETQLIKDEHCSSTPVTIKVEDCSDIKPLSVRRVKKLLNAKQQKTSGKESKQQKSKVDKTLVKSSHIKIEKEDSVLKDRAQEIGRKQLHEVKVETSTNDVSKLDVSQLLALGESQLLNAKQQKTSGKESKQEKSKVGKTLVKSSHIKIEKEDSVLKDRTQERGRKQLHKVKAETSTHDVSKLDVSQLLALGESQDIKTEPLAKTKRRNVRKKNADSEEEGISDWEEVDTGSLQVQQFKHTIPKEGIAVTVQVPNLHQKKKKKRFDVAAYIKRRLNRKRRDIQILMHKAHLLCWVAHGNYVNKILNSEILMGLSLSLIPSKHCYPDKHTDIAYLQQIVKWFSKTVQVQENVDDEEELLVSLQSQFQKKTAKSRRDMVLMFVCVLRSLGINTRLVMSLQPLPLKPPLSEISSLTSKKPSTSKGKKVKEEKQKKVHSGRKKVAPDTSRDAIRKRRDIMTKEEAVKRIKEAAARKVEQAGKSNQRKSSENPVGTKTTIKSESASDSGRSLRTRKSVKKYVDDHDTTDSDEEIVQPGQESVNESKSVSANITTSKKNTGTKDEKLNLKDTKKDKVSSTSMKAHSSDSENNYSSEIIIKRNRKGKTDRSVLSSDSASGETLVTDTKKKKDRCDVWSEVFLESEEKWICVDVFHRQIHCVRELSSRASQPVQYVLAWQDDGTIRDVTRRYCPQWHTVTRKHRVDEEWWRESLEPFIGRRTARDDQEDEDLDRQMQDRPLPTSLGEYKNHPLYVLKKDLLKFQAIYPPDAPTLGFIRGHPVYARECVHTLHSREIWLKEAKVVRLGETPYKIVKARPKWDRMSGKLLKDIPLEIFGPWQVEDYVPPTAVDGKVPRNAYGNVELFKPSMLPGGTVHMQIPGLNRVARKLQIDCAPAVTGFDFHCGACHPVYDGFVVCEEYKDVLAEAWQAEEEEADRRYEEKRLKRIYGNWRRLIKGLFIRERLKARYDFGPVKEETKTKKKKSKKFQEPKRLKTVDSDDSDWEMGQCD